MLTKIFDEKEVQKLHTYIDRGERFVIVTHVSPDGDAIGASLGLFHFLSAMDKDSVIDVIVPNNFPDFLKWMPGARDIVIYDRHQEYAERLIQDADVIFCLDFNELKRIGKLASFVEAADARKVLIDHHLNPAGFCNLTISYPEMTSTSEMVFRLICAMKAFDDIHREAAECIYTGMMTDTGSFTYNSNNPDLYLIVQELLKKGVNKDLIYRNVYQVYSESRLRLMGYVLYEKMKVYSGQKTALITLRLDELNRFRYTTGDTEGFVNLPLSIQGIEFVVFIREDTDFIKISLRSVGDFPCNRFASTYFQGGGHKNASGGEFYGTMADAVVAFEEGLAQLNPATFNNK
ncbi:MAG: bifunctional oligoribonuclease/PAP phosphatase NrnA [Tannerella sp.]|jgi:phosphoesterase RecJ-like protein|nr:bifunctional oligoribonuclease/PAP phosphatase NrnA [Tannerella sp.]